MWIIFIVFVAIVQQEFVHLMKLGFEDAKEYKVVKVINLILIMMEVLAFQIAMVKHFGLPAHGVDTK